MESLSSLYYALTFEAGDEPAQWDLSFGGFLRRARLKMVSLAWVCLALSLFTFNLEALARVIQQGDRGSEVMTLQTTLRDKGYFSGPTTGYYGPITADAVRRFQEVNRLAVDGIAGENTLQHLYGETATANQRLPSAGILKRGQRSTAVQNLQVRLQELGYFHGPTTGYFGALTETAVKQFQRSQQLAADGVVGPNTQARLNGADPETRSSSAPSSADNTPFRLEPFTSRRDRGAPAPAQQDTAQTPTPSRTPVIPPDGFMSPREALTTERPTSSPPLPSMSRYSDGFTEAARQVTTQPPAPPVPPQFPTVSFERYSNGLAEGARSITGQMSLHKTIYGNIAPKSIVYSGRDLFFAQNMMYTHSITVYDRNYNLVNTISDAVNLQQYGYPQYAGVYRGAPVEASFSHDGQYAWVSNYRMYGAGFDRPGSDQCTPAQKTDDSFLYRINTENFAIEQVVKVGSVPKYVATTPDDRYVLVTNWCTDDLSVVDVRRNREVQRIQLGRYPRGIVVDPSAQQAYVAVMGSQNIAKINLANFRVDWLKNVGRSPRHLNIDASGRYLYASLNGEGRVAKIDLQTGKTVAKVVTGNAPRSMTLSADGAHLYVVNYESDTMAKVRTDTMQVVHTVAVNDKPIGITYDPQTSQVWVSCYSGSIMVFNG